MVMFHGYVKNNQMVINYDACNMGHHARMFQKKGAKSLEASIPHPNLLCSPSWTNTHMGETVDVAACELLDIGHVAHVGYGHSHNLPFTDAFP